MKFLKIFIFNFYFFIVYDISKEAFEKSLNAGRYFQPFTFYFANWLVCSNLNFCKIYNVKKILNKLKFRWLKIV